MADRDEAPEGWGVRHRPAIIAGLATPAGLAMLLALTGYFYDRELRPGTRRPVTTQPAPGLETYIHDGANDPYRPKTPTPREPALTAAKRAVVADGLTGWPR